MQLEHQAGGRRGSSKGTPRSRSAAGGWIGLEEASRRLGVSATTLRRWSDSGIVKTFTTPGGHRRFDAESISTLLPGESARPTMEQLGETPERIARAYRRQSDTDALPWLAAIGDSEREQLREHGLGVVRELLAALDASSEVDRSAHVAAASALAERYGVAAARRGASASTTVETFLRFRRPFITELMAGTRRRGLDSAAAIDLMRQANGMVDQLLVATMRAWDAGAADGEGR